VTLTRTELAARRRREGVRCREICAGGEVIVVDRGDDLGLRHGRAARRPAPGRLLGHPERGRERAPDVERARNLTVINLDSAISQALAKLAQRNMQLQCTIQDGQIWVTANDETVQVDLTMIKGSPAPLR